MAIYPKLILDALTKVRYPGNGKNLVEAEMVDDNIRIDGNKVSFSLIFEKPTDPLAQEVLRYMEDSSKTSVSWNFTIFPSQQFKDDFGAALLEYCNGNMAWDDVKSIVVTSWAEEKAAQ